MLSGSFSLFWRRVNCIRQLCSEAGAESVQKKRYRRKNLVEVASYLPERGLGHKFTRLLWIRNGYENSYWTVSKIVEKSKGRLRYYGRLTWRGNEYPREQPVRTWQKRGWRYILDGDTSSPRASPRPASTGDSLAATPEGPESTKSRVTS